MTRRRIRVVLAEDHRLVRTAMRALLTEIGWVDVVGEAEDGREALALAEKLRPDLVLMDVSMPGMNGIEAARRATRQRLGARILILSMHAEGEYVREALKAGVAGYLVKTADRAELEMALAAVARGEIWLSPAVSRVVVEALAKGSLNPEPEVRLTARQREVLQLLAEGCSTKQIAARLRVSTKTVETHRAEMMRRLDIHHVAGLVRYAIRMKIVGA